MSRRRLWATTVVASLVAACLGTLFSQYTHLGSLIRSWTSFLAPIGTTREIVVIVEGHNGDKVRPNREVYANLLTHLEASGARSVAFDVYFEPKDEPSQQLIKETRVLEEALRKATIPVGLIFAHEPSELSIRDDVVVGPLYDPELFAEEEYPPSVHALAGVGVELEGGPVGALAVGVQEPGRGHVPGLAVWTFSQLLGKPAWSSTNPRWLDIGRKLIPVYDGEIPLYYPPESHLTVMGIGEALSAETFQDKVVIVGTKDDLQDTAIGELPGAVVNGFGVNWLSQQRDHGAFHILGPVAATAFAFLLAFASAYLCIRFPYPFNLLALACALALSFAGPSLFATLRLIGVDWLGPSLAIGITAMVALGLRTRSSLMVVREGTFPATCLFLDLKGSLSMGEKLGSHDSAEVKRRILNALGLIVRKHRGVVETSLGDGLYCVFSSKTPSLACSNALTAALEAVNLSDKFIAQMKAEFGITPEIRATLESGRLTASTLELGADRPSTSGRPADFASRLQPIAKQLGRRILMGPESYALALTIAQWSDKLSKIADVPIEGSTDTVTVYSLTEEG